MDEMQRLMKLEKQQGLAQAMDRLRNEHRRAHGGEVDEQGADLRRALQAFIDRLGSSAWQARQQGIVNALLGRPVERLLHRAEAFRVRDDEIAWYLFLCQQTLERPGCVDISQAQRAVPFFTAIGSRWQYASKITGIDRKLDELLHKYRSEPDGVLFEIMVALAYAEAGWEVELLEESICKTPDMRVRLGDRELFVECKRQARTTQYADDERTAFLRQWDGAKECLLKNGQWLWFQGDFHVELKDLPEGFLDGVFRLGLPLCTARGSAVHVLHDSEMATIKARLIDQVAVKKHFAENYVKANSPMLAHVLGGDWAKENMATTLIHRIRTIQLPYCDVPALGAYVDDVDFACGFTRRVDADGAIEKKAKDITKLLSLAVAQVPEDKPSIVHIAAETMEGADIERRRTQKVMVRIPDFTTHKPVLGVRFHRLLANQRVAMAFEMDETIDQFQVTGVDLTDLPHSVVVPLATQMRSGSHWDLYR